MTKKYEFDWIIPVPPELTTGCVFDRWFENEKDTKDNDFEKDAMFKVDEYGFFLYWKSDGRVSDDKEENCKRNLEKNVYYFFISLLVGRRCHRIVSSQ